jgi:hypothetical protein
METISISAISESDTMKKNLKYNLYQIYVFISDAGIF